MGAGEQTAHANRHRHRNDYLGNFYLFFLGMSEIILVLASIWLLAGIGWRVGTLLNKKVCPICAGVSGTWLIMLFLRFFGAAADPAILGILMGGTVVGIAYQGEKRLAKGRSSLLWKLLFVPFGFLFVFGVVEYDALSVFISAVTIALVAYIFFHIPAKTPAQTAPQKAPGEIEEKLNNCC